MTNNNVGCFSVDANPLDILTVKYANLQTYGGGVIDMLNISSQIYC